MNAPADKLASTPNAHNRAVPPSTRYTRLEHFIPIRKTDLVRKLADPTRLSEKDRAPLLAFCRLLDATFHYEFHEQFERLKDAYASFDPDRTTIIDDLAGGKSIGTDELFSLFDQLLRQANYEHLERKAIEAAIGAASQWGIRIDVDLDLFERLDVYVCGDIVRQRELRRWQDLYRPTQVDVAVHQRLVVIFRLKKPPRLDQHVEPESIYIKLFKNIPKQDIDMLLPASGVKMTWLDRVRIMLPTVSGLAISVYKIIKTGMLLAFASFYGLLAFLGLIGGTIGYGVKSFFGYLRTKDKYQNHLTRNLYFQNLDNNAGVLFRILDEAEEQEFREALLAYYLLWQEADELGWTTEQIDERAEQMIQ